MDTIIKKLKNIAKLPILSVCETAIPLKQAWGNEQVYTIEVNLDGFMPAWKPGWLPRAMSKLMDENTPRPFHFLLILDVTHRSPLTFSSIRCEKCFFVWWFAGVYGKGATA